MFTKAETARVKGIGILLLLFHHLFYNVDFVEKTKMEFLFLSEDRIQPVAVMARVCVWLFVFLSAYGLSLQYQKRGGANSESTLQFLIRRWFSLMKAFWPGPMTLILKARDIVPKKTTGGLDTVGIRMPNCDMARLLIKSAGTPIAAPSANTSGRPSPTTAKHVLEDMNGKINAILDGGDCQVGIESTIISTLGETVTILRPGAITKEDVERTLNEPVKFHESLLSTSDIIDRIGVSDTSSDVSVKKKSMSQNFEEDVVPMAPGMKYKHYAPKADMLLFIGDYDIVCKEIEKRKEIFQKQGKKVGVINYGCQSNLEISKRFFKDLRHMDEEKIDVILACGVSDVGLGFAVMNRMMKSAGYNIINLTEEKVGQKIDSRGENDTLPI